MWTDRYSSFRAADMHILNMTARRMDVISSPSVHTCYRLWHLNLGSARPPFQLSQVLGPLFTNLRGN